jgi:hypothetical protein
MKTAQCYLCGREIDAVLVAKHCRATIFCTACYKQLVQLAREAERDVRAFVSFLTEPFNQGD